MNNQPKFQSTEGHELSDIKSNLAYRDELHSSFFPPPKVSFKVFKEQFFDGLRKQDANVRNEWWDLVGNGYGRVDLIDEDGETVTWVPPIIYGFVSRNGNELLEGQQKHKEMKEIHSSAAEARFAKLIEKNVEIQRPPREHVEQWKKLVMMVDPDVKLRIEETKGPDSPIISDEENEEW